MNVTAYTAWQDYKYIDINLPKSEKQLLYVNSLFCCNNQGEADHWLKTLGNYFIPADANSLFLVNRLKYLILTLKFNYKLSEKLDITNKQMFDYSFKGLEDMYAYLTSTSPLLMQFPWLLVMCGGQVPNYTLMVHLHIMEQLRLAIGLAENLELLLYNQLYFKNSELNPLFLNSCGFCYCWGCCVHAFAFTY